MFYFAYRNLLGKTAATRTEILVSSGILGYLTVLWWCSGCDLRGLYDFLKRSGLRDGTSTIISLTACNSQYPTDAISSTKS